MPRNARPLKVCAKPGCHTLTRERYCSAHRPLSSWAHEKSTTQRGYGHAWRQLRRQILVRDRHLCQSCLRAQRTSVASDVDHVRPRSQGGTDEPANLEAICKACHQAKSSREGAKGRR